MERRRPAALDCEPAADGAWLRCDLRAPAGSAAALVGWDGAARIYRAFVVDSHAGAHTLRGRLKSDTLTLRGRGVPRVVVALRRPGPTIEVGPVRWTLTAAATE